MFNNKGGVSKTTTTYALGWMLAQRGRKVLMVDADSQSNLTGAVASDNDWSVEYLYETYGDLYTSLKPVFQGGVIPLSPARCFNVSGNPDLYLLPGHVRFSEYEVQIGVAQELSNTLSSMRNVPGSLPELIAITARDVGADVVIIDLSPSLSSTNKNLLMSSDFFIVPATPDYYSLQAIQSLARVLPQWQRWATRYVDDLVEDDSAYHYVARNPAFLGMILQKYRPRGGAPTRGFQAWLDRISESCRDVLVPSLGEAGLLMPKEYYEKVRDSSGLDYTMCMIPDYNTMIPRAQENNRPVIGLTDEMLEHKGIVLDAGKEKLAEFQGLYESLALLVEAAIDRV